MQVLTLTELMRLTRIEPSALAARSLALKGENGRLRRG